MSLIKKTDLPESHKSYREAAQWMLTIVLGGLAGFLGLAGFTEKLIAGDIYLKTIFVLTGIAIVGTVVCCVFFIFFVISLDNALEMVAAGVAKGQEKFDANEKIANRFFIFLLVFFAFSLLGFIAVGGCILWSKAEKKPSASFELYLSPVSDGSKLQSFPFLILNKNTGDIYGLAEASNQWRQVRVSGALDGTNAVNIPPFVSAATNSKPPLVVVSDTNHLSQTNLPGVEAQRTGLFFQIGTSRINVKDK